jgi:hypothetical protein
VRGALAATLVSAAGALLFWKRRDRSSEEGPGQEERPRAGSRNAGERSSMMPSGETDPLVAAGVAGRIGKKRSAGGAPRKRARKAAPVTEPGLAEPSQPPQAQPGAYPDGSPLGDAVGRTSVEGGSDRE